METRSTQTKIASQKSGDAADQSHRVRVKSDILRDIMPIYHLSKICGLLPVRFALKRPGRYTSQIDCAQLVYGIILLLALTLAQCYGLYVDLRDGWHKSTRLHTKSLIIVTFGDLLGSISVVAVMIFSSPFRWRFLKRALYKLVDVDEKLGATVAPSPSQVRKLSISLISVALTCLVVISTADFFSWGISANDEDSELDGSKGPLNYTPLYFMYVVIVVCELQYAVVLFNVAERFRKLNQAIENFAGKRPKDSTNLVKGHRAARDSSKRRTMQTLLFDLVGERQSSEGDSRAESIDRLITVYGVLCDSIDCVNRAYGLAIMMVTLSCLMNLVITEYFLYNYIYSTEANTWPLRILQFLWITFHFCRMLILVEPCRMVAVRAKRTAALVNQASTVDWRNAEVKKQLGIFSIQVLQRPIEFSACGLFYLNRGLLTSIVGSVTTYVVILVQFQTSDDTKGTKDLIEDASELLRNVSSFKDYLFQ